MTANKELLTDILDGITVLQTFLSQSLKRESLSPDCEAQRQNASRVLEEVLVKIRNSHPSIRPRVNTPGSMKKPAPPPPPFSSTPSPTIPEEDEGEELYEEAESQPKVEDYIEFEPSPLNGGDVPQEMYEAMEAGEEEEPGQDLYEEPGANVTSPGPQDMENYEKPVSRNSSQLSNSSLVSKSQENSGSGAEYAETVILRKQQPPPSPGGGGGAGEGFEASTDWGNVYTLPSKGDKTKPSALKNILIKGYLEKLGGKNRKTWQRRYCVLAGPLMYFYEKDSSKSCNNCIALPSFTVELAENMTNEKKKQFGFKLSRMDASTGKNKDYYFRSNSAEVREKWISSIVKVTNTGGDPLSPNAPSSRASLSATLPRMPSQTPLMIDDLKRKRTSSVGRVGGEEVEEMEEVEEEGELYEDMAIPEEGEEQEEYVPISPTTEATNIELESSEEYVDIVKQEDEDLQEAYEDTTSFQQPPPPLSPPPGPPVVVTSSSIPPPKAAPPPPPPEVDTNHIYTQTDGLQLQKVFVSLWDFAAGDQDELSLHRGDLVYVKSPLESSDWWYGELLNSEGSARIGRSGFFPRNYSTKAFEHLINS